jgi:phosphoribosyl-dephospho-CoA transferase
MNALPRHALAWPTAAGWTRIACDADDDEARRWLARWFARDWPLVVRRSGADEAVRPGHVALGLPLPPAAGKRRLALRLAAADIAHHAPPVALQEILDALPQPWRAPVAALVRDAGAIDVRLRVYGSAAWQALTGLPYLHDGSDLDLLCHPQDMTEVDSTVALFERWQDAHAPRVDGEIVFPGGAAVAWREWRSEPASYRVLVKELDRAALVPREQLLRRLPDTVSS